MTAYEGGASPIRATDGPQKKLDIQLTEWHQWTLGLEAFLYKVHHSHVRYSSPSLVSVTNMVSTSFFSMQSHSWLSSTSLKQKVLLKYWNIVGNIS